MRSVTSIFTCSVCGSTKWGYLTFIRTQTDAGVVERSVCNKCHQQMRMQRSLWDDNQTNTREERR